MGRQYRRVEEMIIGMGQYLLLMLLCNVLLCSILFIFNIDITAAHFFGGLILAAVVWRLTDKTVRSKDFLWVLVLSVAVIGVAIAVNALIRDISCDGNLYHKFAAGILKEGWNPLYDNGRIEDFFMRLGIPKERFTRVDIWVPSYPKASWYFAATVYALTGNIDAGKAMNGLVLLASGGIIYDYLRYKISALKAVMTALMFVAIPAAVAQLFTYYVDGMLGNLLFAIIFILISLSDRQYGGRRPRQLLLLAACIMLIGNLKINGLLYAAAFCAAFFIYWCVMIWRRDPDGQSLTRWSGQGWDNNPAAKWRLIGRLVLYYTVTVIITVLVIGAGTYVTNTIRFGNPFYPILGSSMMDFADALSSVSLQTASPLRQLITMLLLRTNADSMHPVLEWKLPFTFRWSEFMECSIDAIRGGGGIFFSGILIVGTVLFVLMIRYLRKNKTIKQADLRWPMLLIIAVALVLMSVMPAGGQARYSPYIYLLPYLAVFLMLIFLQERKEYRPLLMNSFLGIFIAIIMINSGAFLKNAARGVLETVKYNKQFAAMKEAETVEIDLNLPGAIFNFIDEGIAYQYNIGLDNYDDEMRYYELEYRIDKGAE